MDAKIQKAVKDFVFSTKLVTIDKTYKDALYDYVKKTVKLSSSEFDRQKDVIKSSFTQYHSEKRNQVPVEEPVAKVMPVKKPVAKVMPVEKPVKKPVTVDSSDSEPIKEYWELEGYESSDSDEKPATKAVPVEKPATKAVPVEKPVAKAMPVDKPVAKVMPVKKPVAKAMPVEKPVAKEIPVEKPGTVDSSDSESSDSDESEKPIAKVVPVEKPKPTRVEVYSSDVDDSSGVAKPVEDSYDDEGLYDGDEDNPTSKKRKTQKVDLKTLSKFDQNKYALKREDARKLAAKAREEADLVRRRDEAIARRQLADNAKVADKERKLQAVSKQKELIQAVKPIVTEVAPDAIADTLERANVLNATVIRRLLYNKAKYGAEYDAATEQRLSQSLTGLK